MEAKKGWTCNEFDSSNYAGFTGKFEEWYDHAQKKGILPNYATASDKEHRDNLNIVFDDFADLYEELYELQNKFPQYEIRSLDLLAGKYVRAIKDNNLYILNVDSGSLLMENSVDFIDNTINLAFSVMKGGKS